ncbi:MAG: hypothetical protein ACLR06_16060 [Christensenellaceae bacterium]
MLNFIKEWDATGNYTAAVGDPPEGKDGAAYYRDMLTDDYNRIRELFKKSWKPISRRRRTLTIWRATACPIKMGGR